VLTRAFPKARSAGFTLVELLIAVMVLIILVSLGMPSFLQMLRNAEVRAAAESIANGMQRARAEAVSKNARVQFVLGAGTDTSWTVDYVTKPVLTDPPLDARAAAEGSPHVARAVVPANATTITFNALGGVWVNPNPACPGFTNQDCTAQLTQVDFNAASGDQLLRVVVGTGGSARVCDRNVSAPNVRAC